jgi:hypothetical protein
MHHFLLHLKIHTCTCLLKNNFRVLPTKKRLEILTEEEEMLSRRHHDCITLERIKSIKRSMNINLLCSLLFQAMFQINLCPLFTYPAVASRELIRCGDVIRSCVERLHVGGFDFQRGDLIEKSLLVQGLQLCSDFIR